jgi:hypothetical protein
MTERPQDDATTQAEPPTPAVAVPVPRAMPKVMPKEIGGPTGPEPTRYGDWEHKGRCSDF